MYKIICKDLGFDCDFIVHNNDKEILAANFDDHLQASHKRFYQKKQIFGFINNQNKNQDNSIKESSCVDNCESFRLEKWHIGHRNFP